ncbi:Hypothetical protein GSB_10810 [Giardia duodenalis]|uniref:Eukaryotic rRNA processing protein EBP2 n=2 Tax=Giardia intestinalis TaxID=5741 RepID=C6LWA3_GIAIB|nr:Hypothetical protein GL50581_3061 [Giardia intestinalis ATCC 50581]ESU41746.1 Hypothetical protein GSB_10810 [Giardia intestinalis]
MQPERDGRAGDARDTGVIKSPEDLKIALHAILPRNEYFLDYMAVTAKGIDSLAQRLLEAGQPEEDSGEDDLYEAREAAIHDQAFAAVGQARVAFRKLDIPFFPPPGFVSEMYRSEETMKRVEGQRKAIEDAKLEKERARNLRLQRKLNKQLKHEKNRSKIQSEKAQKEVIRRWKEERIQLKKQGVTEDNLPSLEDVEKKYVSERRRKRIGKNIKYSGRKDFNRKYSERKKNDPITLDKDNFVYRQFSHLRKDDSGAGRTNKYKPQARSEGKSVGGGRSRR